MELLVLMCVIVTMRQPNIATPRQENAIVNQGTKELIVKSNVNRRLGVLSVNILVRAIQT